MMLFLALFLNFSSFAIIPDGNYTIEKIECEKGKQGLKLGGKFMSYDIKLKVKADEMWMTVSAKTNDWASFILNCTQTNYGTFKYTKANEYYGELRLTDAKCNADAWSGYLRKKAYGTQALGYAEYKYADNKLVVKNLDTEMLFSCDKDEDGVPIYYYKRDAKQ
ncbi:MAG: hypothetical protein JNM93_04175 [Bacteriovoracaceae bacterium]|nr:hypothetical protein [Bacteriovoracaceae bacterium]